MKTGLRFKLITSLTVVSIVPFLILSLFGSIDSVQPGTRTAMYTNIMIVIAGLIMALVVFAVLLAKIISRDILDPLKELSASADKIMRGDLDFQITYHRNNEMGRFSTAFELMRSKLQESLNKQRLSEQARKELITSISHDLRTPISSIKGYVEGLQDGIVHDKEKHARYLAVIKDKTYKLDGLIEDLFQFSQLESGQLPMHYELENSQELLEDIVRPMELEFMDHSASLIVNRPFHALPIKADRSRITQVFDNLVSNAAKYAGQETRITIATTVIGNYIQISIADNGTGIADSDLPFIFDRFYRGDKSRSSKLGGSGLGLAICKQIIEDHGGSIGARSEPGVETVFYFTLPVLDSSDE
ncbi:sensor histidine kinase [Paenibacillus eucommiae]|uniref:histidine kinase n=1 Tax=Paenibacillus eucommiae TaxID=1355755 RepID=A0ABS4J051_9BACL|nr:ATP-binding protein [Paenibacillus eucommiae]MBP1993215.1 histidine kinase [Paenibacillus eucommiae]